jgi:hypothetical protein
MDEFLRDRKGRIVGEMKTEGKKTFLYGDHGQILGWYDGTFTYNEHREMDLPEDSLVEKPKLFLSFFHPSCLRSSLPP